MTLVARLQYLLSEADVYGPVPEEQLAHAEEILGFKLPEEYRCFVKEFGAAISPGREVYGLFSHESDAPPLWQHVLEVHNSLENAAYRTGLPLHFLAISDDGMDCVFYLDCGPDCTGVVYKIGPGVEQKYAGTFLKFLEKAATD